MIKLFREKKINDLFITAGRNIIKKADSINDYELFNSEVESLAIKTLAPLKLKHLSIDFENRTAESKMIDIPAENFPRNYDVRRGQKYPCARVSYSYNLLSNNIELLSVSPINFTISQIVDTNVGKNNFTIHYQTLYGNLNLTDEIKKEIKNWASSLEDEMKEVVKCINKEIDTFNIDILELLKKAIEDRKNKIISKKDQDNDLNDF
ncbi:hypothetical protein [Flavobacterium celericrescens]|uniref:Uncharacterized protein n=1 Tax=Flavobacterium celericrescens TaxID=2709780 RepID=A0ABX0IBX9_9FLAO|nr:hypothetical protein [Flavobacterium celericrescens]NHM04701.1 hypothetical protein [Flavobacterium celericrescens]